MLRRVSEVTAVVGLLAAGLIAFAVMAPRAASQSEAQPPVYTYVSEFQVPRASWSQYADDEAKGFVPAADKMVADGTILGYTTFESVVHTPDGMTHGAAWQSRSIAGLMKVLDELRKGGPQKGQLASTKHEDYLMQSTLYEGAGGGGAKTNAGYLRVLCQQTPPGKPDEYAAALKKIFWPTFQELLKSGAASSVGVDQQYVNNGPASMRCL